MQYLCISASCTHVHAHAHAHVYALCADHVSTCRYAAILANQPSGISQAAAYSRHPYPRG